MIRNSVSHSLLKMAKIWLEVCLISARGLRRTSSFWKLQWFSVGWVDPNNKYCTNIDSSGNANPNWRTKFSVTIDTSDPEFKDLVLNVEVYSREPLFLRESLEGTTRIYLKEFIDKYAKNSEVHKPIEDVSSFQLRKGNSSKPKGYVDVSIKVSEEKEEASSSSSFIGFHGKGEGFNLSDNSDGIELSNYNSNYTNSSVARPNYLRPAEYGYHPPPQNHLMPPRAPPPHPPPAFLPQSQNMQPSYVNMPPSGGGGGTGRGRGGFGMGLGAGAVAAGAVIFGDDFMSGYDFPVGLQNPDLIISTDFPF